jgi:3' terminal RNA ribose 2'-O-methyltransferase Hen1
MLFTITYTGENPTDLGYLLHKNPARPQTVEMSFGRAYVFYTETGPLRCTAALLIDIDPLDMVRSRKGNDGIFDYVNDRPYVCSSLMCTAISEAYGTAMSGRCAKKQELADTPLDLNASLFMLPCQGGLTLPELLFRPLGYKVAGETALLDERFPKLGKSPYINLSVQGKVRLRDLLNHLYVLIPVFDRQKHYWIREYEIDKLLYHGGGWLQEHPEKALIVRRYLKNLWSLTQPAMDRLNNDERAAGALPPGESAADEATTVAVNAADAAMDARPNLNTLRLEAVFNVIKESGAESVIDIGCGYGHLLLLLMKEETITRIAGADVSRQSLEYARANLEIDRLPKTRKKRFSLFQSSVTYRDKRFRGYDAATLVEVIEHLEESRLDTVAAVIFGDARPGIVVVTTPNIKYNEMYGRYRFRHWDHRFEWDRARFQSWAKEVAGLYGYDVSFDDIGDMDERLGRPTQMAVFTREKITGGGSLSCV